MKTLPQSIRLRRCLGRLMILTVTALAVPNGTAAEAQPEERLWQLKVAGQPSGSFTEMTAATADGKVRTKETMVLELNRLGSKVAMKTESETVEASDGTVESLTGSVSSSQAATNVRATRVEGAFEVETEAGGKSYQKKIPLTGPVLGPKGVEKLSRDRLQAEGATVSFQMFSVEMGGIVSMTRKAVARLEEEGRPVLHVEETIEGMPGKQVITLDENGRWLTRQQSLPFGELTLEPAAPDRDQRRPQSGDQPCPRVLRPDDGALEYSAARSAHGDGRPVEACATISRSSAGLIWNRPHSASWKNRRPSRWSKFAGSHRRGRENAKAAAPDESYLRPNALVQSDDPEVIRIAQEATNGVTDDFEKARRLQDWVSQNLQFDLGIALAPASEVVRNRRGTCVAYAILLASLRTCRSACPRASRWAMPTPMASGADMRGPKFSSTDNGWPSMPPSTAPGRRMRRGFGSELRRETIR